MSHVRSAWRKCNKGQKEQNFGPLEQQRLSLRQNYSEFCKCMGSPSQMAGGEKAEHVLLAREVGNFKLWCRLLFLGRKLRHRVCQMKLHVPLSHWISIAIFVAFNSISSFATQNCSVSPR
jgi:hypothetical protein